MDHFKATGDYSSLFYKVYGEKPSKIQIVFISDRFSDSCDERWEGRDSDGRLAGVGDGTIYKVWRAEKGEYVECSKSEMQDYSSRFKLKWSVILTLRFIIPAIKGVFGLWEYSTKGDKSTIPQIRDTFDTMLEKAGTVVNIPFDLVVKKVKSQKPGNKFLFPVVSLVPNISQENIEIVRGYLDSGVNIQTMGLLTDEKLNTVKALPPAPIEDAEIIEFDESSFLEALERCDSKEDIEILIDTFGDLPEHLAQHVERKIQKTRNTN